ncbi:MAG TPA: ABC transporter substrate-binding protein [Acidimicrobiales bacterium]
MQPTTGPNRRSIVALMLTLALIGSACGSRRSVEEIAAASASAAAGPVERGAGVAGGSTADSDDAASPAVEGDTRSPSSPTRSGVSTVGPSTGSGSTSPTGDATTGGGAAGTTGGGGAPAPGTGEIVIASVGSYSGIPGSVFAEAPLTVQGWARSVNEGGGIGGRTVKVLVLDDQGDLSRHQTLVRRAVEEQGVIAFVASHAPLTGSASVDYLNQQGVVTIGGQGTDAWFSTSAVHFSVTAVGADLNYLYAAAIKRFADSEGLNNYGVIYCVESASCSEFADSTSRFAEELGMNVVYKQGASIAQPDFTSECLSARNQGVEVLNVGLDGNSLRRLAGACARQSFRPNYFQPSEGLENNMLGDPNLDGTITGSPIFPVTLGGTPAADRIRAEIDRYIGDVDNLLLVAQAWISAMALERALRDVVGDVDRSDVLTGLRTISNEDFGGLTAPITYTEANKNPPICYWVVAIVDGEMTRPDGLERQCRSR